MKHLVAILLIVGGINWGLIGLFDFDLVQAILGSWPLLVKIVYILVGLAGVVGLVQYVAKVSK